MTIAGQLGTAGQRIQFFGTLKQHGTRLKPNGLQERWLLLIGVAGAETGKQLAKRVWFRDGKWSRNMKTGRRYSLYARVERCRENQLAPDISGQINPGYRLANPNKVLEVAFHKEEKDVESGETRTFKVYPKGRKMPGVKKALEEPKQPLATRKERSRTENSLQTRTQDGQNARPSKRRNNTARKRRSTTIQSIFENRREAGSRRVRQWTG